MRGGCRAVAAGLTSARAQSRAVCMAQWRYCAGALRRCMELTGIFTLHRLSVVFAEMNDCTKHWLAIFAPLIWFLYNR